MQRLDHGEHLVQLTRWPRFFPINQFVVIEDDGLTLIDTGMNAAAVPLLEDLTREYQRPLRRIVITHAHGDHSDGLTAHAAAFPEADVIAGARTAAFLRGDTTLTPDEQQRNPTLKGGAASSQTAVDRIVRHGERIGSLEVIAAPGHSPDNVALRDTRDGTLFVGDAFVTKYRVAVSGVIVPLFPFPALATWHRPTALDSALALLALQPTRLAAGHGPVVNAPQARMRAAIDLAARRFASD